MGQSACGLAVVYRTNQHAVGVADLQAVTAPSQALSEPFQPMSIKKLLPAAAAGLLLGLLAVPLASRANGNSDIARRSWIDTLNKELKAGIDYDAVKSNPLTTAMFGVADVACLNQAAALGLAKSMLPAAQARYAVQSFDESYCLVKHQQGS